MNTTCRETSSKSGTFRSPGRALVWTPSMVRAHFQRMILPLPSRPARKLNLVGTVSRKLNAVRVAGLVFCGVLATSWPTQAQTAPSLGTAQDVTILGDTTITNVGATIVNGNVWLSNQAAGAMITGFPPGTVINGSQLIGGALTLQAHNDTLTAYNTLAGEAGATTLTGDLGGRTLLPGVYDFTSSAGLTGNLTLNTGGNPNAIFVIQIGTTLTTATASTVTILGSSADPNIFWQVGSSATLAGSSFDGNILADTSITLNPGAVLSDGKLLAINGAVTLAGSGNTINLLGAGALPGGGGVLGTYWNGSASNLWSGVNWSPDATGATNENLGANANVVFSVTGVTPQNETTTLDSDTTISSLTVNDTVPVTISGANTLTISGAAGATSTLTINNGAGLTTINSNLVLSGLSQGITVNNAAGLQINGVVDGIIGMTKAGTGILTLTGSNTYTGGTTNNAGTLAAGSAGALGLGFVTNNATLETTAAANTVAPRAINVAGAFTQTGTGTLLLEVVTDQGPATTQAAAGINYDTLVATGPAAVAGTLQLDFKAAPSQGERFQAVSSATSDVTGLFNTPATLTGVINPHFVPITTYNDTFGGTYAPHNAVVTLFQPFGSFSGLTPNQISVATNIDTFITGPFAANTNHVQNSPGGTDFFNNIITGLSIAANSPNALGGALDQLSPQRFEILRNVAFDNYAFDVQGLDNYNADVRDGEVGLDTHGFTFNDSTLGPELSEIKGRLLAWSPPPESGLLSDVPQSVLGGVTMTDPKDLKTMREAATIQAWHAFIDGGVDLGDLEHNRDDTHANYTTGKVRGGVDFHVTADLRVGALFGYSHTDVDLDNEGSTATVDSYTPGLYVAYADKAGFYANGLFTYTRNAYTTDRKIVIPGVNETATGSPGGNQFGGNIDGGYDYRTGHWVFSPNVGMTYVNLGIDSFSESGANSASLNVNNQSAQSLRSRLGGSIRYETKVGSVVLRPHFSAYWQHEFLDQSTLLTSSFEGIPAGSFSIQTTKGDRDNALLGIGLDADITRNVTLFVDYGAEAGGDTFFGQSATGGVKIGF